MAKEQEVIFARKDSRNGIYTAFFKGKEIRLKDRELYPTRDKKLIYFLRSDPEIGVYVPEEEEEESLDPGDGDPNGGQPEDHGEGDPDNQGGNG